MTLTERIERQDAEIARLRATLLKIQTQREATAAKKVPVRRLHPPKVFSLDEGETIADSSQETMHLYYLGLQSLEGGQYDASIKSFQDFLAMSPDHVYADRAQFLIAKAQFMNQEFHLSVLSVNALETQYPYSFRIPEALYHRALAYQKIGQTEKAKAGLQEWLHRFPGHFLATSVSRYLKEIVPRLMEDEST